MGSWKAGTQIYVKFIWKGLEQARHSYVRTHFDSGNSESFLEMQVDLSLKESVGLEQVEITGEDKLNMNKIQSLGSNDEAGLAGTEGVLCAEEDG